VNDGHIVRMNGRRPAWRKHPPLAKEPQGAGAPKTGFVPLRSGTAAIYEELQIPRFVGMTVSESVTPDDNN